MSREEIYNALDEVENKLLEIRDTLDCEEIDDDTDFADINNAIESGLEHVQEAMQAADPDRFASR